MHGFWHRLDWMSSSIREHGSHQGDDTELYLSSSAQHSTQAARKVQADQADKAGLSITHLAGLQALVVAGQAHKLITTDSMRVWHVTTSCDKMQ